MTFTLHTLKRSAGRAKAAKRLGRGWGSGKGKYSGKGVKGQKARSGGGAGLKLKGLKKQLQSMPKLSTFKSLYPKYAIVNLELLEKNFNDGDKITSAVLFEKGLINTRTNGVKILGRGVVTKKFTVIVDDASGTAAEAIVKAGGAIKILAKKKAPKKKAAKKLLLKK